MCKELKLCSAFPVYYVPFINLNNIVTTEKMANNKEFKLPEKKYMKIMNLDQYHENKEEETARKTEMRKRTTMLYQKGKKGNVCIEDFHLLKVLGRGAFGKVILAKKKSSGKIYAIKVLKKQVIIDLEQLEHTKAEKKILSHVNHPFLVGLEYAFQTNSKLYFVMEFMEGGELFQHLKNAKYFPE